jgi:hypothetical protein
MRTIQGVSDGDESPRLLDVEVRGDEVFLSIHPPENERAGQDILVPCGALREAVSAGEGRLSGVSPVRRDPKECEVERRPEGLRVKVHPASGKGGWWVLVRPSDLQAALA